MGQPPQPDPLAFFITWTTYGTWLPGDDRGWTKRGDSRVQPPDPQRFNESRKSLLESPLRLTQMQRQVVEDTIRQHAEFKNWTILALNVRTNHVHVIVDFPGVAPETIRQQLKQWATRALLQTESERTNWWTELGSCRYINREDDLEAAIKYVNDFQDGDRFR
ncbi:transposase [Calycomorphotria hydatis]|uniref:Transposase IS200 like protein n=1 Tax=Calycomorphotria hydatis TaxID=2528027 RepID=A0A517T6H6_9PLAN|nr:transposase [Calycomorphotria hydatis]QDT63961.1 Transposase IS200 like protein [Calycomorphotria hydatis]